MGSTGLDAIEVIGREGEETGMGLGGHCAALGPGSLKLVMEQFT